VTCIAVAGEVESRLNQNTVLVVEDDTDLRDALHDVLRDEGYAVTLASNGREAFGLLPRLNGPCGIILDLAMPVMSGTAFYEAMREVPAFSNIPVMIFASDLSHAPSGLPKMKKTTNLERLLAMVAALF
jgi:CheY-like chemotaxis protein